MRFNRLLVLVLVTACARREPPPLPATTLAPQPPPSDDEDDLPIGRLPSDVTPRNYAVDLSIDPSETSFSGDVSIVVSLGRATDHVWLHGQGLRMKQTQATLADGRVIRTHWQQMTPFGLARLDFGETLPAQDVRLLFSYDADFAKNASGLYRVTGEESYVFAQFEAVSARMCFPSFDEPRFKTPFDIAVSAPRGLTVVTTTHAEASADDLRRSGRVRTRFATTVPLPTYLLTFAVGRFDVVDKGPLAANAVRRDPLPFRGIAPRGQGRMLDHAMSRVQPVLAELEAYFGTAYPFDKLDIIAVPGFSGGMENAGAITFGDNLLLLDPQSATALQRRFALSVIAHELAHMWFGDTVTMRWWDDVWLNEAFASWMGQKIAQKVDPGSQADLASVEAVLRAMDTDGLASARRIHQAVETTREITNAFDEITYNKGMGVLAMIEEYAGADKLRDAIRAYLRDYRFANASADDFFAHLDAASPKAADVMRTFVDQSGVPLVDAKVTCNAAGPAIVGLSQERYLPIGSIADKQRRWVIPVCAHYALDKKAGQTCWLLSDKTDTVTLDKPGCPRWLTLNARGNGYYRHTMTAETLEGMLGALNAGELSRAEQIVLFQTLRASVRAGRTRPSEMFKALPAFVAQHDDNLDGLVRQLLIDVQSQLVDPATSKAEDDYVQSLFAKRVAKDPFVAMPKETDDEKISRAALASLLALEIDDSPQRRTAGKHGTVVLEAIEQGKPITTIDPMLTGTVIAVAIDDGGPAVHERVVKAVTTQTDPARRRDLMFALGNVRTGDNIKRTLAALSKPELGSKDLWQVMPGLARRKVSRQLFWDWFRENFASVRDRVPADDQGYLVSLGKFFCSAEGERELDEFFAPRVDGLAGGVQIYAETREHVQLCAARAAALGDDVRRFFMEDDITRKK